MVRKNANPVGVASSSSKVPKWSQKIASEISPGCIAEIDEIAEMVKTGSMF